MSKMTNKMSFRYLLQYISKYKFHLILCIFFSLVSVTSSLYVPILTGNAIDLFTMTSFVMKELLVILLKIIGVVSLYAVSIFLLNINISYLCNNVLYNIRHDAFNQILFLPISYLDSHLEGDITSRLTHDVELIRTGLINGIMNLFTGVITILFTLGFMLYKNYVLALVVFLITPISLLVASFISRHSYKEFKKQNELQGELFSISTECVTNAKLVQTLNYQEMAMDEYNEVNQKLEKVGFNAQWYSALVNPSTRFVNGLVYSIVGCLGLYFVYLTRMNEKTITGIFTIGSLSCFLTYANQYTKPFNEISSIVNELQTALSATTRVMELIHEPRVEPTGIVKVDSTLGEIEFKDVTFSYTPEKELIKNLNLKALHGSQIAIIGPTGSGKTTLVNLLMRFYDCGSGEITLDGTNIDLLDCKSYRSQFGMVLQNTWIFHGTIRENMCYGTNNVTKEELLEVSKKTHLDYFIKNLAKGYDTMISEDSLLSTGQKQLICIARVMLKKPKVLILDEATSNIDSLTEIQIQQAFHELTKNRTSFVIAHRLSTIVSSDLILVMNKGKIVESGTHEELMKQDGFYKKLYQD